VFCGVELWPKLNYLLSHYLQAKLDSTQEETALGPML
jgi:hypothetical protein